MITDQYSNILYLSDLLEKDFQVFYIEFSRALAKNDIYVKILHGTKAVWCRDYMPIQVKGDKYVQFKYQPSYLKGLEHTISDTTAICKGLKIPVTESDIKIDGGNMIKSDNAVILTDRIYKENPTKNKPQLLKEIKTVLEVEKVIIIPANPWEDFGHADGMVRFFDNKTVLVNDYSKSRESRSFQEKLYGIIGNHGLNIIQIPCYPDYSRTKERNQLAYGIYINYLQIGNKVFLPVFGNDE